MNVLLLAKLIGLALKLLSALARVQAGRLVRQGWEQTLRQRLAQIEAGLPRGDVRHADELRAPDGYQREGDGPNPDPGCGTGSD